ncbi:M56 family metallopeptidase [Microbulbifer sp. CAU 1566]|uniref:M56 family metallopeptidase n=1 Tax=Microbulbifer sp. CAU 1566 TaxID=2933269 RepID=UPI002005CC28|nr:M56 family metallopeptidase [Microbulbifer sp. CAU 1566]MCK7597959.1 M56 family metallopeptidase [Microbulbifer sp. CAU 1566]
MTEDLMLAHWVMVGFLLLMWIVEKCGHRWTGYRFIYRMYVGLPLLVCITFIVQKNDAWLYAPEILASLSVTNAVPAVVASHMNVFHWVWAMGSGILLLVLFRDWVRLQRLPAKEIKISSMTAQVAEAIHSPCLKGIFRPVILLPPDYQTKFSAGELELIVAHERVHAQRMDNLWNLVALGLRAVFWFNPLFWLAHHRFRLLQELSCDETVLDGRQQNVPLVYAKALLAASVAPLSKQPLCTHYGDKKMMLKRMSCIQSAVAVSKGAQWLVFCVILAVSGSLAAIAATDTPADNGETLRKTVVPPKYPKSAYDAKEEAVVLVEYSVDGIDGRPFDIRVVENTAKEDYRIDFDNAAINSVKQWRYDPTGKVAHNVRSKITFKLARESGEQEN